MNYLSFYTPAEFQRKFAESYRFMAAHESTTSVEINDDSYLRGRSPNNYFSPYDRERVNVFTAKGLEIQPFANTQPMQYAPLLETCGFFIKSVLANKWFVECRPDISMNIRIAARVLQSFQMFAGVRVSLELGAHPFFSPSP